MINTPVPSKKGSAKPKSAKKGGDTSEACSDVVPFENGLPPIGNIVLEGSPTPSTRAHCSVRSTASKSKFAVHNHLQMLPFLVGHEAVRKRHPLILHPPLSQQYIISNSTLSFIYIYIYKIYMF